jgi:hypothetical protein
MTIEAERATTRPDYTKTAAEILSACRAWYSEPENEEEYKRSGKRWKREISDTHC